MRLALVGAAAVGVAGLATSLAFSTLPDWAPIISPTQHLSVMLFTALGWSILLPLWVGPDSPRDWLTAGALSLAIFAPPLLTGSRLAFAEARTAFICCLWILACWVAASGLLALLKRFTERAGAHYLVILLAICLLPPIVDFAGLELLGTVRLMSSLSPLERLAWAESSQSLNAPLILLALGAGGLLGARRR